eukprot:1155987-Pelagomonas_calceolata.AAC.7
MMFGLVRFEKENRERAYAHRYGGVVQPWHIWHKYMERREGGKYMEHAHRYGGVVQPWHIWHKYMALASPYYMASSSITGKPRRPSLTSQDTLLAPFPPAILLIFIVHLLSR